MNRTLEFIPPTRLPEANIQAEIYRHLRNRNIKCCLEYRMFCDETKRFLRADVVTITDGRILSIIECKSRDNNFKVNENGRQYQQYKSFDIPVFYCMNFKHVERVANLIELLHENGIYKPEYTQTFDDQNRAVDKKDNSTYNWDQINKAGIEYQYFSSSHIRVFGNIDLWPKSGKWRILGGGKTNRGGYDAIIKHLKAQKSL